MKLITKSLWLFVLLILFSCNETEEPPKEIKAPSAEHVDQFIEQLALRIDLCERAFDTYINMIPEEHNSVTAELTVRLHKNMMTALKEERAKLVAIEILEADKETIKNLKALKSSALEIIDTYLDGGKNEIDKVKILVSKGQTGRSPEVVKHISTFELRLSDKYEAYGKVQKELAKSFNVTLY